MNINLPSNYIFIRDKEDFVIKTNNLSNEFVAAAVGYAIRRRLQSTKTIGQARRTASAFCDGQWEVPRATLSDTIREMPVEQLARMLTNEQRQALRAAINNLP